LPLADSLLIQKKALWLVEVPNIDTMAFKQTNPSKMVTGEPRAIKKEKVVPVKKEGSTGGGC
jgi:hypothetical protein